MKMLEGKKSMSPEGALVLVATVFFVFAFYLYATRDKSDGAEAKTAITDVKSVLKSVESSQLEIKEQAKAVADVMTSTLGDLNDRLSKLEKREDKNVNVHMPQTMTFEVVYKNHPTQLPPPPKELFPDQGKLKKTPGSGLPLSKRAGLIPTENN